MSSTHWFADNAQSIGRTPLVRLNRVIDSAKATVLGKIEGRNPAYSVKCRLGAAMVWDAEKRGLLLPGKEIVEPTSGNTGIALAFVAASRGYPLTLTMPETMSIERRKLLVAYGAKLVLTEGARGMSGAVAKAEEIAASDPSRYVLLQQFKNPANPEAHYLSSGPEIWKQTGGKITHFVSSMGTTGTIMGVSKYLKEQNPEIQIVGLQPSDGSSIAGIRRWPEEYLPTIFDRRRVDRIIDIPQIEAEKTMRKLARTEGISAGTSSGGAVWASIKIAEEHPDAVIVCIICDRGDRYLSTGLFSVQD